MAISPDRLLVLHAGTHKTATSYIQSRLFANRRKLAGHGIHLGYPQGQSRKHKPLARALARQRWPLWKSFLATVPRDRQQVIVSAEQFTQPLSRPKCHAPLVELLRSEGFRLRVVVFLRDQPDYINARYVHSIRRLYHHQSFDDYVKDQLAHRSHIFDYEQLLSALIVHPEIEFVALPYGSGLGDPFERLMSSQGWNPPPDQPWLPADPSKGNVQPGCKGVWLAQAVGERLEAMGVHGRRLANTGGVIRRIAEREGWQNERYCGFDAQAAERVSCHYQNGNDRLALQLWGCRWQEKLPSAHAMRRQVFQPPDAGPERQHLEQLVDEALEVLTRFNPRLRQRKTISSLEAG